MRKKAAYTSVFLALACSSSAHAAKNVEIVRYPSLLMIGGIGQSVGVSYSYSEHKTENSASSGSALRETYSVGTTAAILDPHLVNMQILAGLSYSQNFDDRTSTLLNGEYNLVASAFDMSYHPTIIGLSRSTAVISNGYTPSYSLTNNTQQISASLMNTQLPVQAYWVHSTSESSGLDNETSGSSNTFGFSVQHSLKRSESRFSFDHGTADAEGSASSGYSVQLSNVLTFDEQSHYRLSSGASVSDTLSGGIPQRDVSLNEDLSCRFGQALNGSLSDRFSYSSTVDFEGQKQRSHNNTVSASLSHLLYQSLSTGISGNYSRGFSIGGDTTSYGGVMRLNYSKILPAQSRMSLGLAQSRSVQSQNLQDPTTDVRNEVHEGVIWGERVIPAISGRLQTVVSVQSFVPDPNDPSRHDPNGPVQVDYSEGVHYEVNSEVGYIEILSGGIPEGSNIVIAYTVIGNPDIKMQTDATSATASMAIFGRYTFGGSYGVQSQKLISGEADNDMLVSSRSLTLTAGANFHPTLLGMEYSLQSSNQEKNSRISAYGSHTLTTVKGATVTFNIRDSYSMVDSGSEGSRSSRQNSLSMSASYSRKFYRWLSFLVSVGAADSRGGGRYSDFLTVRAVTTGSYNQLQFSLSGQTLYRVAGSGATRDSNISASVTRFF